jgi:hypothetical protein
MRCDLINHYKQLVSVVAVACQCLCFLECRHLHLLGSSFSPRFKAFIPSFETHSRDGPFAVKGKAVASHKPAAL